MIWKNWSGHGGFLEEASLRLDLRTEEVFMGG